MSVPPLKAATLEPAAACAASEAALDISTQPSAERLVSLSQLVAVSDEELKEAVSAALLQLMRANRIRTDDHGTFWRIPRSSAGYAEPGHPACARVADSKSADRACAHLEQVVGQIVFCTSTNPAPPLSSACLDLECTSLRTGKNPLDQMASQVELDSESNDGSDGSDAAEAASSTGALGKAAETTSQLLAHATSQVQHLEDTAASIASWPAEGRACRESAQQVRSAVADLRQLQRRSGAMSRSMHK